MIRGILTGAVLGSVASVAGLAVVSLSVPLPDRDGSRSVLEVPSAQPEASEEQIAPAEGEPDVSEPDAARPEAEPEAEELFNQIEPEPQAVINPADPAPVLFDAPEAPTAAAPIAPQVSETQTAPRPDPTADIDRPRIAFPTIAGTDETQTPDTSVDPLAPPVELQPAPMTPPAAGQSPEAVDQGAVEEPEQELAPSIARAAPPPPALGGGSILVPAPEPQADGEPENSAQAPAPAGVAPPPPALVAPAPSPPTGDTAAPLDEADLPASLMRPSEEVAALEAPLDTAPTAAVPSAAPAALPVVAAPTSEPEGPLRAIEANAAVFNPAEERPLMAVILIDDPEQELDRASVLALGLPITVAIDPLREDAAEVATLYRAAGMEVVLQATIFPDGAEPQDAETSLAATLNALPGVVGMLDTADGRVQGDRALLDAVVASLAESGHGLVAFPQGLNAAEASALREGVPAGTLFRQLDDERERAPVISRFLDRAAFAAAQEGAVIVLGNTYSETVTALYSWALGNRSESVALAPLSAVLLRETSQEE